MTAQLSLLGGHAGAAEFSSCGLYRYTLLRAWEVGTIVCWVMLNPSTADADTDDPTIRRCIDFSTRWGFGGLIVVNLFALCSTTPTGLRASDAPGDDSMNDRIILQAARTADQVVCAWGARGDYRNRGAVVARMLESYDVQLWCFGLTTRQQPKHPLYISRTQRLVELPAGMVRRHQ